ncbi:DUF1465 family protein [Telmatospirillum sp. J64-1]|uniref:DUF1465 family protein n=1 Tax=Telmatospirillum sp. J64-1 TaxID=2502183 RepID=UPI00115D2718|nr:DUF1465 family protein [Telmatospirillum sp. J64-1]
MAQPSLLVKTYEETLNLIVEARNYAAYVQPREHVGAGPVARLRISCESMRVTTRLTQVMAWLMLQRAVQEGELTLEEACAEHNRLAAENVCLSHDAAEDEALPDGLRSLLERSYRLYLRTRRLEDMVLERQRMN